MGSVRRSETFEGQAGGLSQDQGDEFLFGQRSEWHGLEGMNFIAEDQFPHILLGDGSKC